MDEMSHLLEKYISIIIDISNTLETWSQEYLFDRTSAMCTHRQVGSLYFLYAVLPHALCTLLHRLS